MSVNTEKGSTHTELEQDLGLPYSVPRVNLLPPEVMERRAVRKVKIGAAGALAATIAVAAGAYTLAVVDRNQAQDDLVAEQAVTTQLQAEAAKYAQVPRIFSIIDGATEGRRVAMAQDISWSTLMGQIAATYPKDVWLENVRATLASPEPGPAPAPGAAAAIAPLAPSGVATITIQGAAKSHPDVANWLDSLATVPNVADTSLSSSTLDEEDGQVVVKYSNTALLDEGAYTHKYDEDGN
jgi:Tfp pilus assembly protein PilN